VSYLHLGPTHKVNDSSAGRAQHQQRHSFDLFWRERFGAAASIRRTLKVDGNVAVGQRVPQLPMSIE
jgi:hypothetical protein